MTPQELAHHFERCVALAGEWPWRHPVASVFADWLAAFWEPACPPMPSDPPAATSEWSGDPAGIRWFARNEAVLGYVTGHAPGCYRIPFTAQAPDTGSAAES